MYVLIYSVIFYVSSTLFKTYFLRSWERKLYDRVSYIHRKRRGEGCVPPSAKESILDKMFIYFTKSFVHY